MFNFVRREEYYLRHLGPYDWTYVYGVTGRASRLHQTFSDKCDLYGPSDTTALCSYITHPSLAPPVI